MRFFFFEMDIFFPPRRDADRSIVDVFRAAAGSTNAGARPASAWALHEDNPYTINIGLYYVNSDVDGRNLKLFEVLLTCRARVDRSEPRRRRDLSAENPRSEPRRRRDLSAENPRSEPRRRRDPSAENPRSEPRRRRDAPRIRFLRHRRYLRRHPDAFDQGLVNCVLKKIIAHKRLNFIRERDNCDQNAIDLEDRDLQLLINASKLSQKKDELTGNYNFTLVDGAVAVSYMAPFLFRDSLAMHVLTSVPLSSALGKKVVAKELMLWEDDGSGYFSLGGGSKRYLALDGALAPPTGADDFNWLRERVLELAAFARSLDRVLILPPAWHLARRLAAWELVEVASLEEAGVEWREGSFLANPRLDVDESSTFVRCALDPDGAIVVDGAVLKH